MRGATLLSLFSILYLYCAFANAACPESLPNIVKWSEWNKAPTANNTEVTIGSSDVILLDVSTPVMQKLNIYGTLVVDPSKSITISAYFIYVFGGGHFYAGSEDCPLANSVEIVLYGDTSLTVNPNLVGTKVLGVFNGGKLDIHGSVRSVTWASLNGTVVANSNSLTLDKPVDWMAGEKIVIAGTDFYDSDYAGTNNAYLQPSQSEVVTITSVDGTTVTFTPAVNFTHWGVNWVGSNGDFVETRGEVGLLTRNVVVRGAITAKSTNWGGHIMMRDGGNARLSHVEVYDMGQRAELGRYPIHYHNASDQSASYVVGCSIHDTFQRSITVHSTHKLTLRNNVAFRSRGHMYFIEDGNEEENVFEHNLGINPLPLPEGVLLKSDSEPAVFWITNPNNHFYGNVAVEGKMGFWYSMPVSPLALSADQVDNLLRYKPSGDFINNKAHGNHDGLFVDRGQENALPGSSDGLTSYYPTNWNKTMEIIGRLKEAGVDVSSYFTTLSAKGEYELTTFGKPQPAGFVGFTAYKNIEHGMWGRGSNMHSFGAKFADNSVGCIWPGSDNLMQSSVFVGETDNVGYFHTQDDGRRVYWGDENGRNRIYKWNLNSSVVGYSSYDASGGDIGIDINFHNYKDETFKDGSIRRTGAISGLIGPNVIIPENRLYGVSFFNVDNRVLYRGYEVRYGYPNKDLNKDVDDAVKGIVWVDSDGSILKGTKYESMGCGARIVGTSPHVREPNCVEVPAWSAWVCPADYHAYRSISVSTVNYLSDSFADVYTARQASDLRLTRTWDGAYVDIEADINSYGPPTYVQYSYGTTIIVNQDYYLTLGNAKKTIGNQRIQLSGMAAGEYIRVAIPYPTGLTFVVTTGWNGDDDTTAVSSYAALKKNTYFWDASTRLLWLYLTVDETDMGYGDRYGLPYYSSAVIFYVKASDSNFVTHTSSAPSGSAPSGKKVNYCENKGGFLQGVPKVTLSTSVAPKPIFDNTFSVYTLPTGDDSRCQITTDLVFSGDASLHCLSQRPYDYFAVASLEWSTSFDYTGYTHISLTMRTAAGLGEADFNLILAKQYVSNSVRITPFHSDNAGLVTDSRWTTLSIPLASFANFSGSIKGGGVYIQPNMGRPIEFYIDDIKLISATSTIEPLSVFPVRPAKPAMVGPGPKNPNNATPDISGGFTTSGSGTTSSASGSSSEDPTNIKNNSGSSVVPCVIFVVGVVVALLA